MYSGYVSINQGLEETRALVDQSGDKLYYDLTLKHQNNELPTKDGFQIGMQIRDSSLSLIRYINEMKVLLIAKCEGKNRTEIEALDTLISLKFLTNYDDYITPGTILYGDRGSKPKRGPYSAFQLAKKTTIFAELVDSVWTNKELLPAQYDYLSYVKDPNWGRNGIRDKPLAAIITLLTKLQLDIKLQELSAVRKLIGKL